jgi:hypothetical protein
MSCHVIIDDGNDGGAANGHGVAKAVPMKTVARRHATCSS